MVLKWITRRCTYMCLPVSHQQRHNTKLVKTVPCPFKTLYNTRMHHLSQAKCLNESTKVNFV